MVDGEPVQFVPEYVRDMIDKGDAGHAPESKSDMRDLDPVAFRNMTRNELRVLVILMDFRGRNGQSFPSVNRIAWLAGLSERTVVSITERLVEKIGLKKWHYGRKAFYAIPRFRKKRPPELHPKDLE